MHRVREKAMGRSKRPLLDSLHWLSNPCTNRCPERVRRLQQNGAEDGDRRREAEQSGALGGRRKVGEGWEGVECCGGYGGIDLAM
jgi:hypothetical protein